MDIQREESPYLTLVVEDGILIGTYTAGIKVDLKVAKQMVEFRLIFSAGKSYPFFADVREVKMINKEARDYFASSEGIKGIIATAVFVDNFVSKTIGNFFINFSRPAIPTRIFSNRSEAINWLKENSKQN